jgi:hypothetical protein
MDPAPTAIERRIQGMKDRTGAVSAGRGRRKPEGAQEARKAEVAARAYRLWESAGRPAGRDLEYWLLAEQQVMAERTSKA